MQHLSNRHYLKPLFEPASVAIVGATERSGKIGAVLISNMLSAGYRGDLFGVNPKYTRVTGVPCFPSLADLPKKVELAVIATPPQTVPGLIDQCGQAGIRAALVITAGFSETGPEGAALERALVENARRHRLRLIGPNCLGILRPAIGLNASFARNNALPGSIGLISQSGAVCTAMLDWAEANRVGFSSVVSLGGSSDIDFGEIIDYLANDEKTEHILLYIEGIHDARRFLSGLRAAARVKPVILMKTGRHPAGSRAAVSHTGAMVGSDDVFEAVVRRAGVVRVRTVEQLVFAAQALASHVRPRGNRLAVITNGGGPGVMAADRVGDAGIALAELSPATIESLRQSLPANWSHGNPVDLIGDADSARYRAAISACLADEGVDGVLTVLSPQAMTDAEEIARVVIELARGTPKPVLAAWMGGRNVRAGLKALLAAGMPAFRTPEPAVEMFAHISTFYRNQQALMQTPGPVSRHPAPDVEGARLLIEAALADHRKVLSEMESKALLAAFHIPVANAVVARSANEAVMIAEETGFPVALKISSPDITHKSDVGGIRLNLANAAAVSAAYDEILQEVRRVRPEARVDGIALEPMVVKPNGRELIVGVIRDPVFGPAITFGAGGFAAEVHRDRTVALPPLNAFLAADMIRGTRVARLLEGFRNLPPAKIEALEDVLLRVSDMVCELPWLEELDINPLLLDENGAVAADARVVIRMPPPMRNRYAHMAIHPYPTHLVGSWQIPGGPRVALRPIRPEDAQMEQEFVRGLSEESRHFRFMNTLRDLTPAMLVQFTQIDYDREMALVAVQQQAGREVELAVARYVANPDGKSCEFAATVADAWQGKGLGQHMMELLIDVARSRGIRTMVGYILATNEPMLSLCRRLAFEISADPDDTSMKCATLPLG